MTTRNAKRHFGTAKGLGDQVSHAYQAALADAEKLTWQDDKFAFGVKVGTVTRRYRVFRSRGKHLGTSDANNNQCDPFPAAECIEWRGSLAEIEALINTVECSYPDVVEISISGGIDGALSVRDMNDGDYEPWVAEWSVTVWTRDPLNK